MRLSKIVTLANSKVRLRFLALERSLRASGCHLPLWVIPYDDQRFDLPKGASWWEIPSLLTELDRHHAHPMMRKYQCLTEAEYQFVDSDVVFLRNPETVLAEHQGFVVCDTHWNNPGHTCTEESQRMLRQKSTTWQKSVFNAGQFACDRVLYPLEELSVTLQRPELIETCLRLKYHDQPGLNLLVNLANVPIVNLTLPPVCMESTWAGDYSEGFGRHWEDESRKPYLLHWAGCRVTLDRPCDRILLDFLTREEQQELQEQLRAELSQAALRRKSLRSRLRRVKLAVRAFSGALREP